LGGFVNRILGILFSLIFCTANSGRTWVVYHYVTWDAARFDFISKDIGWAIVTIGGQTALVFTNDVGDSWKEIIPIIVE
jgi:photosystem II stability/assembly factor-like uncharacterized protein